MDYQNLGVLIGILALVALQGYILSYKIRILKDGDSVRDNSNSEG